MSYLSERIERGDLEAVEALFKSGDVDASDINGRHLLTIAKYGYSSLLKFLCDQGVDVDQCAEGGFFDSPYRYVAPIHVAAYNGDEGIVDILLSSDSCDVDVDLDDTGLTPLTLAMIEGHSDLVVKLAQKSTSTVSLFNDFDFYDTCIHGAFSARMFEALCDNDLIDFTEKDSDGCTLAQRLIADKEFDALLIAYKSGMSLEDDEETAVMGYLLVNNEELASECFKEGFSLTDKQANSLILARNYALLFEAEDIGAYELNDAQVADILADIIDSDDVGLFAQALSLSIGVLEAQQASYKPKIRAFLDYQPGKKARTVREHIDMALTHSIGMVYEDYCVTTDDDSSDSPEEDTLSQESDWFSGEEEKYEDTRTAALKQHNDAVKAGTTHPKVSNLTVGLARGVHFCPSFKDAEDRREIYDDIEEDYDGGAVGETALSSATYHLQQEKLDGYNADDEDGDTDMDREQKAFEGASKTVSGFFSTLAASADKKEKGYKKDGKTHAVKTRNQRKFDSLLFRFLQTYVESYYALFTEGTIKSDFGFVSTDNPMTSTSGLLEKSDAYTSGDRMPRGCRLDPHFRKSRGRFKHPILGYTDLYSMAPEYAQKHGLFILDLIKQGKINISWIKCHEYEIAFASHIPGVYHKDRIRFKLPRFDQAYSSVIQSKFGLSRQKYDKHRDQLMTLEKGSDAYWDALDDLIRDITPHMAKRHWAAFQRRRWREGEVVASMVQSGFMAKEPATAREMLGKPLPSRKRSRA